MAYKVKVRFQDTNEEIELIEESYNNNGALLFFYHDSSGNYLQNNLTPFNKWAAHSIFEGMGAMLGKRLVLVVEKSET
ncbi:hypothetical protein [Acinetobacter sp. UBA2581]|uniref:hypothetical protein n=1 Tax=Acinetobacter sp. UBA2581 TaxID=1945932 RepID=UPI0005133453|nr:hypothetical protein [Acinetobacter sp. UBA2581]KGH50492.1 hypothetical protein GS19_07475 [Acinetobacter idrijaensis]